MKKQLLCSTALVGFVFLTASHAYAACSDNTPISGDPPITCSGVDNTGIDGFTANNITLTVDGTGQLSTAGNTIQLGNNAIVDIASGATVVSSGSLGININNNADITINGQVQGLITSVQIGYGSIAIGATGQVTADDVGINILSAGGPSTVDVAGTLGGSTHAVQFAGADDVFIYHSGATVTGIVDGAGGADEFHYNAGSSSSLDTTLIGTQYLSFDTFHKDGAATLTLTGTTAANWVVGTGTLIGTVNNLNNVDIESGSTLRLTTGGTLSGDITGAGDFEKIGGTILTLEGTNTFTGELLVDSASLQVEDANAFSAVSQVSLNNGALFRAANALVTDRDFGIGIGNATIDNNANALTLSGNIGGAGILTLDGGGSTLLTGNNSVAGFILNTDTTGDTDSLVGDLTLNGITVTFNQGSDGTQLGDIDGTGNLVKNGAGDLALTGTNTYSGGTTINAGTLTGDADSLQGNIANNGTGLIFDQSGTGTFTGAISGTAAVEKMGAGTLTINTAQTYSGTTYLTDGVLAVSASNNLGDGSGTNNLYFYDGTLRYDTGFSTSRGVSIDGGTATFDTNSNSATLSGVIDGTGNLAVTGGGTMALSGTSNTYLGDTSITGGATLLAGNTGSLGNSANNLVLDDGTFEYSSSFSHARDISVLAGGGELYMAANVSTLSGSITGTGDLSVAGGGILTLSGDNTGLSGDILLDASTLRVSADNNLGGGGVSLDDATLEQTSAFTNTHDFQLTGNNTISLSGDSEFNGDITGAGSLTKDGTGRMTLSGSDVSYSGGTTINAGALQGTSSTIQGDIDITIGTELNIDDNTDGTYAGDLTGAGTFLKTGTGQLTLFGNNSGFSGTMDIQDSRIVIGASINAGAATLSFTDAELEIAGGGLSLSNNIVVGGTDFTFVTAGNGLFSGTVSGTADIVKEGAGRMFLNGTNTYVGNLLINEGAVRINSNASLGNAANDIEIDDGALEYAASFDHARDILLQNANSAIDTRGFNSEISGDFTGTGRLNKNGAGTLTLAGTGNTYSGGTLINGGTLAGNTISLQGDIENNAALLFEQVADGGFADDISGTGAVTFDGGATYTLSGTNTYSGGTTITSGSAIEGNTTSIQGNILNDGDVTFEQNVSGTFTGDISGTGALTIDIDSSSGLTLVGTNTYSGGTSILDGYLIGDTDSLQGDVDVDTTGVLSFDQNTDGVFGGNLSGTGGLAKLGAGEVTLTGTSTLSGDINIIDGTLVGNVGNLIGDIINGGAVVFDQATNATYLGTISGPGDFVKDGAGNLTLDAANGISNIIINDGTLTGTTASLSGATILAVVNDGTLAFDQSTAGSFVGDISGTGELVKDGTGVVTLTGANTYSGGTVITQGGLVGDTDSLQGDIDLGGALTFDQAAAGTYAGELSGAGLLTVDGGGNLNFTGDSTGFTGDVDVTDGTARINADYSNADFAIAAAGILGGIGDLGNVSMSGRLAPGNSIGTINTGDFDFLAGSVYEVEINDALQSDLLNVTGAVTIDPTASVYVDGAAGTYAASNLYTIITSTMGITGLFDPNVTTNLAFLDGTLLYVGNDVQLRMDRNDINYSEVAADEGQAQVADALESIGAGNDMVDAFTGLTDQEARDALDDLSGESVAGNLTALTASASMIQNTITTHLTGLMHKNDENMLTAALSPVRDPGTYIAALLEPAAGALPNWDNNQIWMQVLGGFGHADARRTTPEQDRHSYGALVGLDFPLDKGGWYGFFGGYETGEIETDSQRSSSDVDNYHVGAYATVPLDGGLNISAGIQAAYHDVSTQRYVVFPGFEAAPKGETEGATVAAYAEVSKPFKVLNAAVEPFAAISVTHSRVNGYTEEEGGSANLDVSSSSATNPATTLGVRIAKMVRMEGLALKLNATLGWQHVYGNVDSNSDMRFVVGGTGFQASGTPRERDSILFGIGLDGKLNEQANAYVNYNGTYSNETDDHAFTTGVKIKF